MLLNLRRTFNLGYSDSLLDTPTYKEVPFNWETRQKQKGLILLKLKVIITSYSLISSSAPPLCSSNLVFHFS
jgi:hypothetical protein